MLLHLLVLAGKVKGAEVKFPMFVVVFVAVMLIEYSWPEFNWSKLFIGLLTVVGIPSIANV